MVNVKRSQAILDAATATMLENPEAVARLLDAAVAVEYALGGIECWRVLPNQRKNMEKSYSALAKAIGPFAPANRKGAPMGFAPRWTQANWKTRRKAAQTKQEETDVAD